MSLGITLFYSQVTNLIQSANTTEWSTRYSQWITQNQNVGNSNNYGVELVGEWKALENLLLGGNYTYTQIDISSPSIPDIEPEGQPEHYAFLYAKWRAWEKVTFIPSVELSSSRYTAMSSGDENYVKTSGFALANLSVEYQYNPNTTFSAGIRNIFDTEYQTQYLFTQAGRSFFMNGRLLF